MQYYAFWYQLDSEQRYLLWVTDLDSDAKDFVVLNAQNRIISFNDLRTLNQHASRNEITITEQRNPTLHNLDFVSRWVFDPLPQTVDCVEMLNAWNMFLDVWQSAKKHRDGFLAIAEPNRPIYDKLFAGNNIPACTPKGQHYVPTWDADEIDALRDVMSAGLHMVRKNLDHTADAEQSVGHGAADDAVQNG